MANASKHKFKDIKKKLKADLALSIHQILNKANKAAGGKAKKIANTAAAKVAKDFIKKLKKEEKSVAKPAAKRKPAKKATATAAPKRKPAARKRPARKLVVKKETVELANETPAPIAETSHENIL
jgi:hypothetical protein